MRPATHGIVASSRVLASGYDAATQAVLDYGDAEGYAALSTPSKAALDAFIVTLKANSLWAKFDRLFLFALDNANYGLVDIKNPSDTTNATNVNSCTHAAGEGFTGNGTTSYIDTNFNPSTQGVNYVRDNAGRGLYLWTNANTFQSLDGVSGSGQNRMIANSEIGQRINQSTLNLAGAIGGSATGTHAIYRYSSTAVSRFVNTTETSSTATSSAPASTNQFVLRSNTGYSAHKVSLYWMGASLNSTEHGILNTAINTLIAAL